ncbi:MAG: 30S ribosomal protein S8 [Gammaproteobacteria bacterium]|nr:30S ribosomal protein S8 [Gammaproteobacteria bacterium]
MSMQDPISDMLIRIKNAQSANFNQVIMPGSKLKASIAQVMKEQGYIEDYRIEKLENNKQNLEIKLKYFKGKPVIAELKRASRPGRRLYRKFDQLPVVKGGLGVSIISTSKGVMTGQQAKKQSLGGEVICLLA